MFCCKRTTVAVTERVAFAVFANITELSERLLLHLPNDNFSGTCAAQFFPDFVLLRFTSVVAFPSPDPVQYAHLCAVLHLNFPRPRLVLFRPRRVHGTRRIQRPPPLLRTPRRLTISRSPRVAPDDRILPVCFCSWGRACLENGLFYRLYFLSPPLSDDAPATPFRTIVTTIFAVSLPAFPGRNRTRRL